MAIPPDIFTELYGTVILTSLPLIPLYLRKLVPVLERISDQLGSIIKITKDMEDAT